MRAHIEGLLFVDGFFSRWELFASIVPCLGAGYTVHEIASLYGLTDMQVYNYLRREKKRCGVDTLAGLVGYWFSHGWMPDSFKGCIWG